MSGDDSYTMVRELATKTAKAILPIAKSEVVDGEGLVVELLIAFAGQVVDRLKLTRQRLQRLLDSGNAHEPIFVLSVMKLDENGHVAPVDRRRTWGWFPTLAAAETSLMANEGDMYEDGYYNHAVVEKIPWSAMALADEEHWYAANPVMDAGATVVYDVKKIDKPKGQENICSYGMG